MGMDSLARSAWHRYGTMKRFFLPAGGLLGNTGRAKGLGATFHFFTSSPECIFVLLGLLVWWWLSLLLLVSVGLDCAQGFLHGICLGPIELLSLDHRRLDDRQNLGAHGMSSKKTLHSSSIREKKSTFFHVCMIANSRTLRSR